jgi:tight adherence protein B
VNPAAAAVGLCGGLGVAAVPTTRGLVSRRLAVLVGPQTAPITGTVVPAGAFGVLMSCAGIVVGFRAVVALAVVVVAGRALSARSQHRRQVAAASVAIVDMCRAIAAELRAGHAAGTAFLAGRPALPAAAQRALGPSFDAARRGAQGELADALLGAAGRPGLAGLRRLSVCWRVAAGTGGALAPALDRVAEALQDDLDLIRDLGIALAAPRATASVLATLPVVGLLLGTVVGAHPLAFLFGSPAGVACLAMAGGFDAAGLMWGRRIAGSVARRRRS